MTGALLVTILTMFTITRGSQTVHGSARPHPPRRGSGGRWSGSCGPPTRAATPYTLRTLALAVVSGVVAGMAAYGLEVPAPSVLGLWVGLWSLIPVLGLVDRLPAGHRLGGGRGPDARACSCLADPARLAVVLAALARRRWIARHSVDVSRLLLTLAAMTGLHVGRITGAVVGVFLAAAIGAPWPRPGG